MRLLPIWNGDFSLNLNTEKFSPPQVEKGILSRKKLLIALDASENLSDARFVYLNAPGGYGKTVAIAQWLKPLRNKLAWLCLDEHDNTPARFARQLLCALSTAQKSNRKLALAAEKISPSPTEHLLSSLELLLPNEKQYTLVLDDLHTVASNEVMKALSLVLKRLPLNFTVYLLSRLPPNDTLLDFVLKGRMTVLGANELTFDKEEIGRLFVLYGRKVCEAETQSLFDRTGGWPIAVRAYLTAQSTEEKTDTDFGNVKDIMAPENRTSS